MRARLRELIPGGAHTYAKGDDQFPDLSPGVIARGSGCHVWDVDGNEFIEYGMGLRAVTLGHAYAPVVDAVRDSLALGTNFTRPAAIELECAETFLETVGAEMVKFTKDGSTATSTALKLARAHTGRELVAICADHPFFSYDDWFICTTTMDGGIPKAARSQTLRFRYNDLESLRALFAAHAGRVAAVFLEAARTDEPSPGFLEGIQDLCRQNGTVFVLDEMITGFRWAVPGAQKAYGITADLSTFGKAMEFVPASVNVAAALVMIGLLAWSVWRVPLPGEWIRVRDWLAAGTGVRLTATRVRAMLGVAVVVLYLGSGLFTVHPGEVGIRTRFGRIVDSHLGPGLHARLPWPIEDHVLVGTDHIRRIEVGFRSPAQPAPGTQAQAWAGTGFAARTARADLFWFQKAKVSDESFLLTGDENLIDVAFTAEYQVKDAVAFHYDVADADTVVRSVTMAALRAVLATMTVDAVYTTKRDEVEQRVVRDVQQRLDEYGIGVRMVGVNLLSVHAPEEVHAAFRDVASAQEDKVLIVNRAITFAQESVNLAEGDAAAMIESARAFKDEKILQAQGDALAFTLRENEYRRAPDLTRFRLHLEALEEVLPAAEKIVRPGRADVKDFDLWLRPPLGGKKGQ